MGKNKLCFQHWDWKDFVICGISGTILRKLHLSSWDKLDIEKHTSLEAFLEKYKPEENNMYFVTTKGQTCYSDVDYSKFDEVFLLFGKETKGLPEDLLQKWF